MRSRNHINKIIVFSLIFSVVTLLCFGMSAVAQEDDLTEEEWAFLGIGLAILAICMVIILVIAILIAVWLYKDAEKRGKSGGLWVLILILAALFFNIIGVVAVIIIWMLVRPPLGAPGAPQYGPPPQQPGYPPQQPPYYPPQQPPQQPGYPPQQPPQ
jgi:uncharacterized membrane protein YhaH (DUF805 family)